ncbi:MAG: MGMT family protein [Clostridia bacterium]|nr:MGMT family protein [Deltaproteobacteria bacterium]
MKSELSEFSKAIIAVIQSIPRGKVATYGQVAAIAGNPRAARRVAWLLSSSSHTRGLPWQRVVNARGEIAFCRASASFERQKALLRAEGVLFVTPMRLDLVSYQWKRG